LRKILQASGGAIAGDYFFSQKLHQRYSATYRYITIPGGTTFTKRKIMKIAEITVFQRFFIYVLPAKICNLVQ
jgi:hypothetical protein